MDSSRFDSMFKEHYNAVFRYLSRRHSGSDVEDLVAEVFTIAWEKVSEIPSDMQLPWLYRTSWFVVANNHRKISEIPTDHIDLDSYESDVADIVIDNIELKQAWLRVPERDREILRLVAWEGLTPPEVSQMLGISLGGASSAISRARKNLDLAIRHVG